MRTFCVSTIVLVACLAASASAEPTGVLDLELVQSGASYVLRDPAVEVTFPGKPTVTSQKMKAPNGNEMTFAMANLELEGRAFLVGIVPIGNNSGYDPKTGLAQARDRSMAAMKATLLSEKAATLGGLDGRHAVAKVTIEGRPYRVDAYFQWDPDHRIAVTVMTLAPGADESAAGKAFVASYARSAGNHSPLDPAPPAEGKPVSANALDFELVRRGSSFVLRDAVVELRFLDARRSRRVPSSPVTSSRPTPTPTSSTMSASPASSSRPRMPSTARRRSRRCATSR